MKKTLKGILLTKGATDPDEFAKVVEFHDELDEFYRLLDCDMIEMPDRKVDKTWFTVICDEEGLLKAGNIPVIVNTSFDEQIFGNVLLVHINSSGNVASVKDEDIDLIRKNITKAYSRQLGKEICILLMQY